MKQSVDWPTEFTRVISCCACTQATHSKLLRDSVESVPQPGYIGPHYMRKRVLLTGQNPGTPKTLTEAEQILHNGALRALRDEPNDANYKKLSLVLQEFIPKWPVHGNYFPFRECGLTRRLATSMWCVAELRAMQLRGVASCETAWPTTLVTGLTCLLQEWSSSSGSGLLPSVNYFFP